MSKKELSLSVDINELQRQLEAQREAENTADAEQTEENIRSTVFTLGKDPRVSVEKEASAPDLYLLELLKDRLDNFYVKLNWRIPRSDIDSGRIVGFDIYKKRLKDENYAGLFYPPDFSRLDMERAARGNKKAGKFSEEKKSINNVKKGSIPTSYLNSNLDFVKSGQKASLYQDMSMDSPTYTQADFERYFSRYTPQKIGYIDYTKYQAEEKKKFLYVKDRNFVEISYKDKAVGIGESFEYYIICVLKKLSTNPPKSNSVPISIEDSDFVSSPKTFIAKQTSETEINLLASLDPKDKIKTVVFYRRTDEQPFFEELISVDNINNSINVTDGSVDYSKKYHYRVFAKNMYQDISEPKEIKTFCSVQKVTPESRSNSLKIPIISAIQDQNSNNIKIVIYPNDPSVSFYELKRRDLTIKERRFSVPSKDETNYGADGWTSDKFFVEKEKQALDNTGLKTQIVMKEIVFIDDTVDPDHLYQYRTRGYDLFGNPTSYAFSTVRSVGKKSIRSPINIKSEVVRGFPYRVKILWNDDNLYNLITDQELFDGESSIEKKKSKFLFKVQRRKINETVYESFPSTVNNYIVDEISCLDAITFDGKLMSDIYSSESNTSLGKEGTIIKDEIRRAFKLPNFLQENETYFYRIIAVSESGEESNPSEEFQIIARPDLSEPLDFNVNVVNARVKPLSARLSWSIDPEKAIPDKWVIERKFDTANDSFSVIGSCYLSMEYYDRHLQPGNTYVYRIKSVDVKGEESIYVQARLSV